MFIKKICILDRTKVRGIKILRELKKHRTELTAQKYVCVIKKMKPHKKLKTEQIHWFLKIRNTQPQKRMDGSMYSFLDHGFVLLKKEKDKQKRPAKRVIVLYGKHILGPIPLTFRKTKYLKAAAQNNYFI